MQRVKPLDTVEVEYVAFRLARESMTFSEPIPDFSTRFPYALESCLHVPFQTFRRKHFYPGLIKKTSILFYLMIKNHPFQNGNKRLAVTVLLAFLYKNKKWLIVNPYELYKFAVQVAKSPANLKKLVVFDIEKFIKKYLVASKRS